MEEMANKNRVLTKAINLGHCDLLPWPFLIFLVLP
jgi:hypothetical protein